MTPCHGIYGDIKHLSQDDTVTISKNGKATNVIFEEYLDYKRGYEANYLDYFSGIKESSGSPFLNQFSRRNVSKCDYGGNQDCMKEIELELKTCQNVG